MYAYRNEKGWIQPRILFQPDIEPDGAIGTRHTMKSPL
jgi:hypothetical protein